MRSSVDGALVVDFLIGFALALAIRESWPPASLGHLFAGVVAASLLTAHAMKPLCREQLAWNQFFNSGEVSR